MLEIADNLLYLNVIVTGIAFVMCPIDRALNCILKLIMFGALAWNVVYLLEMFGYIVKAGGGA